jgi:hypothetical protein
VGLRSWLLEQPTEAKAEFDRPEAAVRDFATGEQDAFFGVGRHLEVLSRRDPEVHQVTT